MLAIRRVPAWTLLMLFLCATCAASNNTATAEDVKHRPAPEGDSPELRQAMKSLLDIEKQIETYVSKRDELRKKIADLRQAARACAQKNPVARITAMNNAVWKGKALNPAARLKPGDTIELKSGLVEITFDSGPVAILEGPCEFRINGRSSAALLSGKLVADTKDKGFYVDTPTAKIVDLGSEFGLAVDEKQGSQVTVFEGSVELAQPKQNGDPLKQTLRAGEGAVVSGEE